LRLQLVVKEVVSASAASLVATDLVLWLLDDEKIAAVLTSLPLAVARSSEGTQGSRSWTSPSAPCAAALLFSTGIPNGIGIWLVVHCSGSKVVTAGKLYRGLLKAPSSICSAR
jgi:hypothetical protein